MTTNNTITAFASKEEYLAFIKRWKVLAHEKKITRADVLLRCILMGKDPLKALAPTKNPVRLANGAENCSGLMRAKAELRGWSLNKDYYEQARSRYEQNKKAVPAYVTQALESPLLVEVHWGAQLNQPDVFDNGLSLYRIKEAMSKVAHLEI